MKTPTLVWCRLPRLRAEEGRRGGEWSEFSGESLGERGGGAVQQVQRFWSRLVGQASILNTLHTGKVTHSQAGARAGAGAGGAEEEGGEGAGGAGGAGGGGRGGGYLITG